MINKILTYLKSGGLREVFYYSMIKLKKLCYYKSETIFLYRKNDHLLPSNQSSNGKFKFITLKKSSDLEELDFGRIKTLNYQDWIEKGSVATIGTNNNLPVSFSWSHFRYHPVHGVCSIDLSDDKCWIGPTFVDKKQRGKGLNKAQIIYQMHNVPGSIQYFLTSANASNIPSIKSFEKLGFQKGSRYVKYVGLFANKTNEISYMNKGKEIFNFL